MIDLMQYNKIYHMVNVYNNNNAKYVTVKMETSDGHSATNDPRAVFNNFLVQFDFPGKTVEFATQSNYALYRVNGGSWKHVIPKTYTIETIKVRHSRSQNGLLEFPHHGLVLEFRYSKGKVLVDGITGKRYDGYCGTPNNNDNNELTLPLRWGLLNN